MAERVSITGIYNYQRQKRRGEEFLLAPLSHISFFLREICAVVGAVADAGITLEVVSADGITTIAGTGRVAIRDVWVFITIPIAGVRVGCAGTSVRTRAEVPVTLPTRGHSVCRRGCRARVDDDEETTQEQRQQQEPLHKSESVRVDHDVLLCKFECEADDIL
jgi:hypothetical protein